MKFVESQAFTIERFSAALDELVLELEEIIKHVSNFNFKIEINFLGFSNECTWPLFC